MTNRCPPVHGCRDGGTGKQFLKFLFTFDHQIITFRSAFQDDEERLTEEEPAGNSNQDERLNEEPTGNENESRESETNDQFIPTAPPAISDSQAQLILNRQYHSVNLSCP